MHQGGDLGRHQGIRLLADPGGPALPGPVLEWAGRDAITRRIGKHKVSVIELSMSSEAV